MLLGVPEVLGESVAVPDSLGLTDWLGVVERVIDCVCVSDGETDIDCDCDGDSDWDGDCDMLRVFDGVAVDVSV